MSKGVLLVFRYEVCPYCKRPLIRVGCHALCSHCGYQEGCGD